MKNPKVYVIFHMCSVIDDYICCISYKMLSLSTVNYHWTIVSLCSKQQIYISYMQMVSFFDSFCMIGTQLWIFLKFGWSKLNLDYCMYEWNVEYGRINYAVILLNVNWHIWSIRCIVWKAQGNVVCRDNAYNHGV